VNFSLTARAPGAVLASSRYEYAEAIFLRLASALPSRLVVDLGAGDGQMRERILRAGGSWRGFDAHPKSAQVLAWDLEGGVPREARDAGMVLLLDVLEHLRNPGLAVAAAAQIVAPSGMLVLTAPNPLWSRSRLHALHAGVPACFTREDLMRNGHVFTSWPHVVEHLLAEVGFECIEYATLDGRTRWPGRPLTARYPLRLAVAALCKAIERRDAAACGLSFGLVARKGRSTPSC
jgi:SAM-dependent methyltransferase